MDRLNHRVVLVTGASRGIGAATATLMASEGAAVVVNYNSNAEAAAQVVAGIEQAGGRALAIQANAADREATDAMVRQAESVFGTIDTLVINAGIQFPVVPFVEYPWEAFETKVLSEMKAAFFASRAVIPGMIQRGGGCIVAISSGLSRTPGEGFCAHSAAKSGLDGLMKSLALELGPKNIRVNVVAPGLTLTDATSWLPEPMKEANARATPMRRIGMPGDVAGAVLMLASEDARFVTGAYIPVSGGRQML